LEVEILCLRKGNGVSSVEDNSIQSNLKAVH